MRRTLLRYQVFKILSPIVSITIAKMANTYKAGLTLCGAFLIVFCFVRMQDLDGRQSQECKETDWKPLESIADIGGYNDCGLLGRLYRVGVEGSEIRIPGDLRAKLRLWLQEDEELIQQSTKQRVIQITNKVRPALSTQLYIYISLIDIL